jgi:hypothetical protein
MWRIDMKEHPILFRTEMVQAIMDGRKSQTRRVIKNQRNYWLEVAPHPNGGWWAADAPLSQLPVVDKGFPCPYGQVGDHLWVRETFKYIDFCLLDVDKIPYRTKIEYKADGIQEWVKGTTHTQILIPDKWRPSIFMPRWASTQILIPDKWRPSIFMPRWASRITLEITGIRVQRVREISGGEIIAEGILAGMYYLSDLEKEAVFKQLWDSINGKKYPWSSNPWVWVIEFKKL